MAFLRFLWSAEVFELVAGMPGVNRDCLSHRPEFGDEPPGSLAQALSGNELAGVEVNGRDGSIFSQRECGACRLPAASRLLRRSGGNMNRPQFLTSPQFFYESLGRVT